MSMITVTKTFFPPLNEYESQLKRVWKNEWLTNRGELVVELEDKLKEYLKLNYILITTNGTIPLQIALKLFGNGGQVITTPFSYIATSSSIVWEGCSPIFVDIHPEYLTIDESKIESAINERTTAILATHVFGNPCNIENIQKIASKYNLKVIYDAAHCFGVEYNQTSIFEYGDISTCSFHATKIFHTGEGGAIISNNKELFHKCFYSHNFGHNGPLDFHGLGINGKISELQAAMGLAVFPYINTIIEDRKRIVETYNTLINFNNISKLRIRENTKWNYSYYPIILPSEEKLLKIIEILGTKNVIPRRYFYPSLNTIKYLGSQKMPISESISKRIICLPMYYNLSKKDISKISEVINMVNL